MDGLAQCFLWIDESPTEQENDRIVRENAELQDHIQLLHAAFGLLPVIIRHATHRDSSELAFLRLGIRLFNSAGAAFKLVRSGYYQSALAAIRDVVEIQFLLDLFRRDQQEPIGCHYRQQIVKSNSNRSRLDVSWTPLMGIRNDFAGKPISFFVNMARTQRRRVSASSPQRVGLRLVRFRRRKE